MSPLIAEPVLLVGVTVTTNEASVAGSAPSVALVMDTVVPPITFGKDVSSSPASSLQADSVKVITISKIKLLNNDFNIVIS
ncbi:MAG: hypothetical protein DRQ51_05915 [Gammaproteobacteria bacterium]|nr:MAG: hypothetical protein DRQ51_05915 [Gammaproteobacteria bacterium]